MSDDKKDWISTTRAAEIMEVSKVTAERWRWRGYGPPWHRHGPKLIRYKESEVRAWLKKTAAARMSRRWKP